MSGWSIAQLLLTPILAALTTLWVQSRQNRERISCFVDWKYGYNHDGGPYEFPYLGVHNRSPQPIAVHRVKYLKGGVFLMTDEEGTALAFEDPTDLDFPYMVQPGEIKILALDRGAARRIAESISSVRRWTMDKLNSPRIMLEVRTTADTRIIVPAESALPWDERIGRRN